jgi:hypothetical protein
MKENEEKYMLSGIALSMSGFLRVTIIFLWHNENCKKKENKIIDYSFL